MGVCHGAELLECERNKEPHNNFVFFFFFSPAFAQIKEGAVTEEGLNVRDGGI